jgi:hypothetical protein
MTQRRSPRQIVAARLGGYLPRDRTQGGLRRGACKRKADRMIPRSPLDDPATAAYAWARFRRLMWLMLALTITTVIGGFVLLYREHGLVSVHFYIATALGISFMMLLTSALMGLVFLSHGTGHDEAIVDPLEDEDAIG